jgi:hypothetical protein
MGYTLLKYIFKKVIIKAVFVETSLYPFSLKKVLNKLPLLYKVILEKDLILTTISIITLDR